jgi:hypothetical protein
MKALERLKARLEKKDPNHELTKLTKPTYVGFVSSNYNTFSKIDNHESANYRLDFVLDKLQQFRFNLLRKENQESCLTTDLDRVNNMAWEFMKVDGLPYNEAIKLAAEVVASCEISVCEAAYEDVQALWIRLSEKM